VSSLRKLFAFSLLTTSVIFGCSSSKDAGPTEPSLDEFVAKQLEIAKLPGVSAAIVKNGKVVWTRAWGYADVEKKTKATPETIYFMGSVSKTVTGAAAMQMVDAGKLSLDADVNDYLTFKVRHPKFPDVPITLRMLMTHTSSITETQSRLVSFAQPGDSTITLQQLTEGYLVPGGAYYSETDNFTDKKPGTTFSYSNFAVALVGHLIERASGMPFDVYCREKIFKPLGMNDTSYRLSDLDLSLVATPYTYTPSKGLVPEPQRGVPYLPATNLRVSAPSLGRFLAAMSRGGELDSVRVLPAARVKEMQTQAVATGSGDPYGQGLLWEIRTVAGAPAVGHKGSFYGASTSMHHRPAGDVGVVLFANGDVHLRISLSKDEEMAAFVAIEDRLYAEASKL